MNNKNFVHYPLINLVLFLLSVVLIVIVVGLILGKWLVVPFDFKEMNDKYEVFNDLLTIFLSLLGVIIGLLSGFGVAVYYMLKHFVREDAIKAA